MHPSFNASKRTCNSFSPVLILPIFHVTYKVYKVIEITLKPRGGQTNIHMLAQLVAAIYVQQGRSWVWFSHNHFLSAPWVAHEHPVLSEKGPIKTNLFITWWGMDEFFWEKYWQNKLSFINWYTDEKIIWLGAGAHVEAQLG